MNQVSDQSGLQQSTMLDRQALCRKALQVRLLSRSQTQYTAPKHSLTVVR